MAQLRRLQNSAQEARFEDIFRRRILETAGRVGDTAALLPAISVDGTVLNSDKYLSSD